MRVLVSGKEDFSRFLAKLSCRGERGLRVWRGASGRCLQGLRGRGIQPSSNSPGNTTGGSPSSRTVEVSGGEIEGAFHALSRRKERPWSWRSAD